MDQACDRRLTATRQRESDQEMYIESRGLIHDATDRPDAERIAFFTSLCPLRSGTILSGFQVGRSKHAPSATIRVCRSRDEGATWSELPWRFETVLDGTPGSLAAAELVEAEPGRLLLFTTWFDRSDPARPLFDPVTEGILRSRQLVAASPDEGESWSPWTRPSHARPDRLRDHGAGRSLGGWDHRLRLRELQGI